MNKKQKKSATIILVLWVLTVFGAMLNGYSFGVGDLMVPTIFWGVIGFVLHMIKSDKGEKKP
jgi:hypothetical protein